MVNYILKNDLLVKPSNDIANFYQKSFALALLNWELNRQEDRLKPVKIRVRK